MSKWSEQPVFWLMEWLVESMRAENLIPPVTEYMLDTSDTGGDNFAVPFFMPVQQTAEATNVYNDGTFANVPFAVYTVSHTFEPDMPYMKCGELGFVLYSTDTDKLFEIANYLLDVAGRSHWSAADMNRHFSMSVTYPFEFKSISIDSAAGPMETDDEGGRFSYMITIKYDCTYEGPGRNEVFTSAPFGYPFSDVGMV